MNINKKDIENLIKKNVWNKETYILILFLEILKTWEKNIFFS